MSILVRPLDLAGTITTNGSTRRNAFEGPMGAPKASYVREVLLVLKGRLTGQLNADGDGNDPVMVRTHQATVRQQLEQINVALIRIEQGKYGVCADCLKPIEADRLAVRPYSTLCQECQNRRDRSRLARI